MRPGRNLACLTACLIIGVSHPAFAGWKLIPAQKPANVGGIIVSPQSDWNQASAHPGKQGISWTHDGFDLNGFEFFAGVPTGGPLYRERDRKRNPMPKFDKGMLLPDLADFFERSFRARQGISDFTIAESVPAELGGYKGLAVRYRYSLPNDDLVRLGVVRLAIVRGKLYVANFNAPQLHYFASGLGEAEAIMNNAKF